MAFHFTNHVFKVWLNFRVLKIKRMNKTIFLCLRSLIGDKLIQTSKNSTRWEGQLHRFIWSATGTQWESNLFSLGGRQSLLSVIARLSPPPLSFYLLLPPHSHIIKLKEDQSISSVSHFCKKITVMPSPEVC